MVIWARPLSVLSPLVLAADLLFFLRGEIIRDVECLADFLRRFALDHISNGLAPDIQKRFDVEVVAGLEDIQVSHK